MKTITFSSTEITLTLLSAICYAWVISAAYFPSLISAPCEAIAKGFGHTDQS